RRPVHWSGGGAGRAGSHQSRSDVHFPGDRGGPRVHLALLFSGGSLKEVCSMAEAFHTPPEADVVISTRDLRVKYGTREILHGISFDVRRGETVVILGGSGSGKSTLLRTLVGLEAPSSGHISIKGRDITSIPRAELDEIRKKIGMSFQGGALFGSMTV